MGDDNLLDWNVIDLDLNEEPIDHPRPSEVLFNEFETTPVRIEERLRHLEGVTARSRRRREHTSTEFSHLSYGTLLNVDEETGIPDEDLVVRAPEKGKGRKMDSSDLVAKALKMEAEVKKAVEKEGGSFYDCNICLELAKEPVLTCCGHLFCWACFYQVSDVDSTSKECPVCKGEVSEGTVIPIYGNGSSEGVFETENGLRIPPRPKAHRVESARQQRVSSGMSPISVAEALRRIHMGIGGSGIDTERQGPEAASGGHESIHQVSRVISNSAASLNTLSSALSNAERLVEDLETAINRSDTASGTGVDVNAATLPDDRSSAPPTHGYSLRRRNVESAGRRDSRRRRLN